MHHYSRICNFCSASTPILLSISPIIPWRENQNISPYILYTWTIAWHELSKMNWMNDYPLNGQTYNLKFGQKISIFQIRLMFSVPNLSYSIEAWNEQLDFDILPSFFSHSWRHSTHTNVQQHLWKTISKF